MRVLKRLGFVAGLFGVLVGAGVVARAHAATDVQAEFKRALEQSATKTAPLEAWQKKIFEEEVLVYRQRFIRDYRPTAQGLSVDVDHESLSTYLKLYAPKLFTKPNPKMLILVSIDSQCEPCERMGEALEKRMMRWGVNRGFVLTREKVPALPSPERIAAAYSSGYQGVLGLLLERVKFDPNDPDAAAHADEPEIRQMLTLALAPISEPTQGSLVLKEAQSVAEYEQSAGRVWVNLVLALTPKALRAAGASVPGAHGVLIDVYGVQTPAQWALAEAELARRMTVPVMVGEVRAGVVTFKAEGMNSRAEAVARLSNPRTRLRTDRVMLRSDRTQDAAAGARIAMEVRP